ncbi:hypothetical protein YB2330_001967 [Saitoella coloradoensis]
MATGIKAAEDNGAFRSYVDNYAHITDYNERRRLALAEVDQAKFGWWHVRAVLVAGIGFFTDSYDIFAINIASVMLGYVFWDSGKIPTTADTAIKASTSGGTVIGQLGFGYLADVVGRKKMYGLELIVILVATLGQALSATSPAISIVGLMIFWRTIMGVGIGGDYPLSSVITSEFATTKWRGFMMNAVFAMQGFGQLAAALVALVCVQAWKGSLETAQAANQCDANCKLAIDKIWRIIIGFGAIPGAIALYYRLTIPESPRYTLEIEQNTASGVNDAKAFLQNKAKLPGTNDLVEQNENAVAREQLAATGDLPPKASFRDFWAIFGTWRYGKYLLGTAGCWFTLDVAYYGLGLNNSIILQAIGYASQSNVYKNLYNVALGNVIITCAGAIPGYWVSAATIDIVGRKPVQLMGFTLLTVIFIIIGFAYNKLPSNGLFALYVLAQFFFNFGPNSTTFIVPGELFPTRYRSTAHGISAASGKIGAILAQVLIGPLRNRGGTNKWLNHVMQIFSLFMFLGIPLTLLVPETKRKTLEEVVEEYYPTIPGARMGGPHKREDGSVEMLEAEGSSARDVKGFNAV